MDRPTPPAWLLRARELHARMKAPGSIPFRAAKKDKVATLYLYDAIGFDPWSDSGIDPMDVVNAIKDAADADTLEVHINSPGGYITEGLAIFNAIRAFAGKKIVCVDGIAASIASVIALAGDRVCTNEGAMWMIHEPAGGLYVMGTAEEIEDSSRKTCAALRKMRENIIDIYTSNTGQGVAQISAWMSAETFMTADEALARGFTDEVKKQDPVEPCCDPENDPEEPGMRASNPADEAESARIRVRSLANRFPRASPGAGPGQPGTNTTTPAPRQKVRP